MKRAQQYNRVHLPRSSIVGATLSQYASGPASETLLISSVRLALILVAVSRQVTSRLSIARYANDSSRSNAETTNPEQQEEQTEAEHQIKVTLDAKVGLYSASASASAGGKESKTSSEIDKNDKIVISSKVRYFVSAILMATDVILV